MVDTYTSRYGRGRKRENGFLTHRGTGAFCYGFYPHGNRPIGRGEEYRATVMGPGVTPILFWQDHAPGAYDPDLDAIANEEQAGLFQNDKCRVK
jgi:phosphoketolase